MRRIILTAALSTAATLLVVWSLPAAGLVKEEVKIENRRVTVTETSNPAGVARDPYVRPSDQVIVFLDDCSYDRIDPKTGAATRVNRKAGDVIWHDKGEQAPKLDNKGKAYRTVIIGLK